ncbi:hypothetical protein, partial [Nocardioides fonticola]|uniref:hypothetical protein n=1 Tax=Nocardioides fonticola TaxID=450363 RepID=UPI0031D4340A
MFDLGILEQLSPTPSTGAAAQPLPHDPVAMLEEITALEDSINRLRARQARLAVELAQVRAVESMPR